MYEQLWEVLIIPFIGVLVGYFVTFINAKKKELMAKTDSVIADKYIAMIGDTITECVLATKQTYVDSLKASGSFDEEAQHEAFARTLDSVIAVLSNDAKSYITETFGDLEAYLTAKIEARVNMSK